MTRTVLIGVSISFCLGLLATDAAADRRGTRVDGFGDQWTEFAVGTAGCPGTIAGNTILARFGGMFSGRNLPAYLTDDYCQSAEPGTLTSTNFTYIDEPGLNALFGPNPGNGMKAIRYSYLDRPRFDFDNPATGFQWTLYYFPSRITVVGLYGLVNVTLTSTSFITQSGNTLWNGANGFNGEYFCFNNNTYIGIWNGTLTDPGSQCLTALKDVIFACRYD
jgi:hypothetical protein